MEPIQPILLRPSKAATLADISRSVAYELIRTGQWPSIRVGRSIRVPVADLMAWIAANKNSTIA